MNPEHFKKTFFPLHPKLYRIAFALLENRDDAEDALQDLYLKLWDNRTSLSKLQNPEAYCVTLIKNRCLDALRRDKYRAGAIAAETVAQNVPEQLEMRFDDKNEIEIIRNLIEKLPENQRKILRLAGFEGCTQEEIENITGLTGVNIRVLLSRARKTLREELKKIYENGI